jgi:hypothetical protein
VAAYHCSSGELDVDAALALGVPRGRLFAELKEGRSVQSSTGAWVEPGAVVGPDRPGRRLVVAGETTAPAAPPRGLDGRCDAIIASASYKVRRHAERVRGMGGRMDAQAAAATPSLRRPRARRGVRGRGVGNGWADGHTDGQTGTQAEERVRADGLQRHMQANKQAGRQTNRQGTCPTVGTDGRAETGGGDKTMAKRLGL